MADQATSGSVIRALAGATRVLTLGGVAVIAHGLSRNTFDADIWVDPMATSTEWSALINGVLEAFPRATAQRIALWEAIPREHLARIIEEDGVVRIADLERPLDIFRKPNELDISLFDEVWDRATALDDGTRLPDIVDLLVTKQLTGREKDRTDIVFLEGKAEAGGLALLDSGKIEEIRALLDRFLTPRLAAAAAHHADSGIRELGLGYLRELAAEGDPFAADLLREFPPAK